MLRRLQRSFLRPFLPWLPNQGSPLLHLFPPPMSPLLHAAHEHGPDLPELSPLLPLHSFSLFLMESKQRLWLKMELDWILLPAVWPKTNVLTLFSFGFFICKRDNDTSFKGQLLGSNKVMCMQLARPSGQLIHVGFSFPILDSQTCVSGLSLEFQSKSLTTCHAFSSGYPIFASNPMNNLFFWKQVE